MSDEPRNRNIKLLPCNDTFFCMYRYLPRYNLGGYYLGRFYPGSLSQKRILVIINILFWVSEPG